MYQSAIVIPCFNSEKTLEKVINESIKHKPKNCILIVVNDGSTDSSFSIIKKFSKRKDFLGVNLAENHGVGFATRTGINMAIRAGARKIVTIDADLQHPPEYIPTFLEKLDEKPIVLGYRRFEINKGLIRTFGNIILTLWFDILFFKKVKDSQCGMRGFSYEAVKSVKFVEDGYEFIFETLIKLRRLKYASVEIPSIYSEFPTTAFRRGLSLFFYVLKMRIVTIFENF